MSAMVRVFENFDHLFPGLRLTEKADEPFVLEVSRDVLKSPEMISGLVRRRDQEEKDVDFLAVEGGELNAVARECDGPYQTVDRGMTRVRHRDTLTDPRRTEFFSPEDGAPDAVQVALGDLTGVVQAAYDLPDRVFLTQCFEVDDDRLAYHEIR